MKKFRNNLHLAFFFPGSNGNGENPDRDTEIYEVSETEKVVQKTQEDLKNLKEDVAPQGKTPSNDMVGTYDVDPNHEFDEGENDEIENVKTRKMVKFLAHELPNYLWEVKDKNFIQKMGGIPLISNVKVDAPSFEDKKQVEAFVKAVDKLDGENPELALLNVFKTLEPGATEEEIKQELQKNGVTLKKEKYIKRVKKAFDFYCSTQLVYNNIDNQHALYLSILQIVQKQGGFDATREAFKQDVADYKERRAKEGKEYRKGEKLDANYKAFAEMLGVQDFTSATRLAEKGPEYFKDKAIVDILADLNNDGTINFADRGLKTGAQFKEIYNMVGEEVALPNLLAQAKLLNATLTNVEGITIPDGEFTPEQIKAGNKKLILMLQSIISNPGIDLNKLLKNGPDAAKRDSDLYESLLAPESADDPVVQEAARTMLEGIDLSEIKVKDAEVASSEGLHQAVAGALYAEYARGAGIGAKVPFDQWVKGLSLNGGFQASESGVSIGLNLAYNHEINLGKGWSVTPGASIGFIPMFKFGEGFSNPNWTGSAGVELAKQWLSQYGVYQKVGGRLSFTEVFGVAHVYSAFVGWERDKVKGIEKGREGMKKEFNEKITTPLLDGIAKNFGNEPFDLEKTENKILVELAVDQTVKSVLEGEKSKFNDKDIQRLKQNIIRYLINYNKAPIANEEVRHMIANEMSEQYSYAWAEQRMNDINGKTYLAGARVGFSWVQLGALGTGVLHAGLTFKTQSADMYGDATLNNSKIEALEGSTWTQEMINHLNKYLLVSPGAKFSLKEGYIVIPKKAMSECDIRINPEMKGLIKKDEAGNILLSNETYMNLPEVLLGGARKSVYLLIGGGDEADSVKLQSADDSWFTEGNIDVSKLPGKENIFTKEGLESVLNRLKVQIPDDEVLQNFHFDESILAELEKGKKYIISLEKKGEGIQVSKTEIESGDPLQIEYLGTEDIELMSEEAKELADSIYGEARKVTSNALYNISHDKNNRLNANYQEFAHAVMDQDYDKAKSTILAMLPKMDKYINQYQQKNNKIEFSKVSDTLQKLEGAELGKALMSINNVFARVSSVHGGVDGEYHFKRYDSSKDKMADRTMGNIVEARAKEISRKIDNSNLDEEAKVAYKNLIAFAEQDRVNNPDKYNVINKKAETLNNAIGINLGNAINIENPLFNPEVYEGSVIEDVNFEGKDILMKRALSVVANNKALIDPIKKALSIEGDVSVEGYENGQLNLDINGKNVILKADMKFAYFAQCVNHMLILDNIQAEVPGGEGYVNFGPSVMGDGVISEATVRTFARTSRTTVDVAATVVREKQDKPEEPAKDTTTTPTKHERDGDATTTPGADDEGPVDTGGETTVGGEGQGGTQGGEMPGGDGGDDVPPVGGEGQTTIQKGNGRDD